MTRLVARLILAMLLLPLTGALLLLTLFATASRSGPTVGGMLSAWSVVYTFIALYWLGLWAGSIRWGQHGRIWKTAAAGLLALACGFLTGLLVFSVAGEPEAGVMVGGGVPPIVWVLATVLLWRETAQERLERLARAGGSTVACPICAYNMTGLREARCPECGAAMTLDELLAGQAAAVSAQELHD